MSNLILARLQFAATTVYHFFFVPLTLGLSVLVAIMETMYVKKGDEIYRKMAKFWGTLFVINFAMGVVTGLVQEFQFGMNWSEYSRFMGDIFGVPLAIEALLAFFMESVFLGAWIFGWDKLSKKAHAVVIWLVAIGSNLSALWILIANSYMQHPVGYRLEAAPGTLLGVRAVLVNFFAVLTNPHVWLQWPHVFFSALTTAGFFILGISAYHLLRNREVEFFSRSMKLGVRAALIGTILVTLIGHFQAQWLVKHQPMKMAAAEALWEDSGDPAGLSLFAWIDEANQRNTVDIKFPGLLSFLAYNRFSGSLKGIKTLEMEQAQAWASMKAQFPSLAKLPDPPSFVPPVTWNYWSFRLMVGLGLLMLLFALWGFVVCRKGDFVNARGFLRWLPLMLFAPYLANTFGWLLAELGRQPWVVYGLLPVNIAVSPNVSTGAVAFSLVMYVLIYALLMIADVYLLAYYGKKGPEAVAAK